MSAIQWGEGNTLEWGAGNALLWGLADLVAETGAFTLTGGDVEFTFAPAPVSPATPVEWTAGGGRRPKTSQPSDVSNRAPKIKLGAFKDRYNTVTAPEDDAKFWRDVAARRKAREEEARKSQDERESKAELARSQERATKALAEAAKPKPDPYLAEKKQVAALMKRFADEENQMVLNAMWAIKDGGGLSEKSEALIDKIIDILAP